MTCPFNFVSQCPVVSVPVGFSAEKLPIGMQIVGHRFDDLTVMPEWPGCSSRRCPGRLPVHLFSQTRRSIFGRVYPAGPSILDISRNSHGPVDVPSVIWGLPW